VPRALNGFDDWENIRLDQIGAGRNLLRLSNGDNDVGDNDVGDNDVGDNDVGDNDVGDNDVGDNDVGDNDVGDNDVGATEQDFESTKAQGRTPPYALETCRLGIDCSGPQPQPFDALYHKIRARMQATAFGHVVEYEWELKRGPANSTFPWMSAGGTTSTTKVHGQLPNGIQFTTRARAEFDDPAAFSAYTQTLPVTTATAVNDAPVANNETYPVLRNSTTNVPAAQGVLANDTDVDTPNSLLVALQVGTCSDGTLTLNTNGSFTYRTKGFLGMATCTYKATNGFWSVDPAVPMSSDSNVATITFNVMAK
jgi:cadherin-like protein